LCSGKLCADPKSDRMTFVDAHQTAFAQHGVCARADDDPEVTAATPAPPEKEHSVDAGGEEAARRSERILFGESDDLLSDVDTGVNENEFKW